MSFAVTAVWFSSKTYPDDRESSLSKKNFQFFIGDMGLWAKQKVPAGGGGAYNSCEDPESFLPKYNDSYLYFFFCYYKHSIVLPVIAS